MTAHYTPVVRRLTHIAFFFVVSLIVATCSASGVFAGSGLVSQVGGATFIQGAKQFWVTSSTPTFSGVTSAGVKVSGTVGPQIVSATTDASGNWSWTPTTALSGAVPVTITAGTTTTSFTLNIGSMPASVATASASALAPAGSIMPTLIVLGFGGILTCFGLFGLRRSFLKTDQ